MQDSVVFTIFGGTGDLTFRKLLPALYNMHAAGKPEGNCRIMIIGRRDYTTESYRELMRDWVKKFARLPYDKETFAHFAARLTYYRMNFADVSAYNALNDAYHAQNMRTHIFYFAVAPRFFSVITEGLTAVQNAQTGKIILEKPFGENLAAAKQLNRQLESFFAPDHIYRIDHYLGKEMVRNIETIRFSNSIFSNLWNSKYIESVQISACEDIGVESRGNYYDASGALKDMVQNHLFQILSIVAMEFPEQSLDAGMHEAQLRVLRALRPVKDIRDALVLGQYQGYRQESAVAPDSVTETYAALRLFIDNERWWGTPFYIRTGKKLSRREMEIAVLFRRSFLEAAPNILIIKIQPTEGVYLQFNIKTPGDTDAVTQAKMDFCQSCSNVNRINTPEAYERLIGACVRGEKSWFSQWDQIEASWEYIEQLRAQYQQEKLPIFPYAQGASGPIQADELLNRLNQQWL